MGALNGFHARQKPTKTYSKPIVSYSKNHKNLFQKPQKPINPYSNLSIPIPKTTKTYSKPINPYSKNHKNLSIPIPNLLIPISKPLKNLSIPIPKTTKTYQSLSQTYCFPFKPIDPHSKNHKNRFYAPIDGRQNVILSFLCFYGYPFY